MSARDAAIWPNGDASGIRFRIFRQSIENMEIYRGFPMVYREDAVSSSSIAFHQIDHNTMRRYEMLLYGTGIDQCGKNMTIIP